MYSSIVGLNVHPLLAAVHFAAVLISQRLANIFVQRRNVLVQSATELESLSWLSILGYSCENISSAVDVAVQVAVIVQHSSIYHAIIIDWTSAIASKRARDEHVCSPTRNSRRRSAMPRIIALSEAAGAAPRFDPPWVPVP